MCNDNPGKGAVNLRSSTNNPTSLEEKSGKREENCLVRKLAQKEKDERVRAQVNPYASNGVIQDEGKFIFGWRKERMKSSIW